MFSNDRSKMVMTDATMVPASTPAKTALSLLAEAGVSLERIMERLGHSEDKTTKQIYLHTTQSVRKRDSEKFSNLMKTITNF
ncbi:Phage integrase family protein [Lentibacillus halodurans]|uniref:Phage integrase family protein n=1 Tax=Lentibacillus halodurans TaxID=237679 RepID=A0A1I1AED9_9BACI|nr:Phage integrase family protein [Lentibacillus halodurans]